MLRICSLTFTSCSGLDLIDAHWLLVAPRLAYCLFSFIIDFCLWRIASLCKLPTYSILTAFSTSYIALGTYRFILIHWMIEI